MGLLLLLPVGIAIADPTCAEPIHEFGRTGEIEHNPVIPGLPAAPVGSYLTFEARYRTEGCGGVAPSDLGWDHPSITAALDFPSYVEHGHQLFEWAVGRSNPASLADVLADLMMSSDVPDAMKREILYESLRVLPDLLERRGAPMEAEHLRAFFGTSIPDPRLASKDQLRALGETWRSTIHEPGELGGAVHRGIAFLGIRDGLLYRPGPSWLLLVMRAPDDGRVELVGQRIIGSFGDLTLTYRLNAGESQFMITASVAGGPVQEVAKPKIYAAAKGFACAGQLLVSCDG